MTPHPLQRSASIDRTDSRAMMTRDYPRDLIGYGRNPPHAQLARPARASPCSSS